jgi:hypothetical protein
MNQERVQTRDVARLVVPRCGQLVSTGDLTEPYRLIDAGGAVVEPVATFLRELLAAGRSPATLRSYGMDLLRWWRFLGAVDVGWRRAAGMDTAARQNCPQTRKPDDQKLEIYFCCPSLSECAHG